MGITEKGRLGIKKMRGNFNMQAALGIVSPGFNINDAGYLSSGNLINMEPGKAASGRPCEWEI